jgi:hypothetical protein
MRTSTRLTVVTAVLGGGLLLAGPAGAQEVDCDQYPDLADCVIEGEVGSPATGSAGGGSSSGGGSSTAGGASSTSSGSGSSLPFTGGEVTLIALAGTAALGGGVVLTAAGRKRKTV